MEITFEQQLKLHSVELQKFAQQSKENRRLWNIDLNTAEYLYDLILHNKPEKILEIGTSNGFSTFWLSLAAESVSLSVDSIEVDEKRYQLAKENLQKRKNVTLLYGLAENLIPEFNRKIWICLY